MNAVPLFWMKDLRDEFSLDDDVCSGDDAVEGVGVALRMDKGTKERPFPTNAAVCVGWSKYAIQQTAVQALTFMVMNEYDGKCSDLNVQNAE
mmetsp:Transcript_8769/g.13094  ORF Transcript_8769/g.13094 Transcript_8769/m.13094 type:complete len:92 (-) Transcript_8769:38-313(-)